MKSTVMEYLPRRITTKPRGIITYTGNFGYTHGIECSLPSTFCSLFSKDCVHWGLLPPATEAMKQKSNLTKGRFTGDPSYEFEHIEMKKVGDGDDQTEEEETASIFALLYMMTQSKHHVAYHLIFIAKPVCI